MQFRVEILRNGEKDYLIYDHDDNKVTDSQGRVLNPIAHPLLEPRNVKPYSCHHNPNIKGTEVPSLEIILGFKCNLNCNYCTQRGHSFYSGRVADVEPLVQRLRTSGINPKLIKLWGGEPMVYWTLFKTLTKALKQEFPSAQFTTFTNGTLLTQERVDFLKENNFFVSVSCDGLFARGGVNNLNHHLEELKYAVNTLNENIRVFSVLTEENSVFDQTCRVIRQTLGKEISITPFPLRIREGSGNLSLSQQALDNITESIFYCGQYEKTTSYLTKHVETFEKKILSRYRKEDTAFHLCDTQYGDLIIDMQGAIFNCHSIPEKVGMLEKFPVCGTTGLTHWKDKPNCPTCPLLQLCAGGCPKITGNSLNKTCRNLYAFHLGVFKAVFARLFGVYVQSIKPINEESKTL